MANFQLLPGERILLQVEQVERRTQTYRRTLVDLSLTNTHLVLVSKGALGRVKDVTRIPLADISRVGNRAQVHLVGARNETAKLDIQLREVKETFSEFPERHAQVVTWVNTINRLVTGVDEDVEVYTSAVESAIESVRALFGGGRTSAAPASRPAPRPAAPVPAPVPVRAAAPAVAPSPPRERAAGTCNSCCAPISGPRGSVVQCGFCDQEMMLA